MASNDLPDIVFLWGGYVRYYKWAENGQIIPLDSYLDSCSNIKEKMTKEQMELSRVPSTGKIHSVQRPTVSREIGGLIRKDWLNNLNLKVPDTLDEFYNVLKRFTFDDPDRNGENDTYGWTIKSGWEFCEPVLMSAFDVLETMAPNENGVVTIAEMQDGYLEMLDFYRLLYNEDVLDPEWYTNGRTGDSEKFKCGKVGLLSRWYTPGDLFSEICDTVKNSFPGAKIDFMLPIKNKSGERTMCLIPPVWGSFGITSSAKYPGRTMSFIDWCFSDEGIQLFTAGIEGLTYDMFDIETGKLYVRDDQLINRSKYISDYMSFITGINGRPIVNPGRNEQEQLIYRTVSDSYRKNVNMVYYHPDNVLKEYNHMLNDYPDIQRHLYIEATKYIVGEISREEFADFLKKEYIKVFEDTGVLEAMRNYYTR